MDQYRLEREKGNGTFSVVFEAVSIKTGQRVAIKCMKKKFQSVDKVRRLKEIQALTALAHHENVIKLIEVLFDEPTGKLALVFELMEMNLYEYLKSHRNLPLPRIKYIMFQVLKAIEEMHRKGIFHRDIKPENILVPADVQSPVKIGYQSPHPFTDYISTRWYRAPQCLMTDGYYNEKMDIWGFGCVLFELITKYPLFPGKDELDQVHRIHHILGTPAPELLDKFRHLSSHMEINFPQKKGTGLERLLPNIPFDAKDLLKRLLEYDASLRISAQDALKHQFFSELNLGAMNDPREYFRSTLFPTKHIPRPDRERSDEEIHNNKLGQSGIGTMGASLSKPKKHHSKNNLEKFEQDTILPKIANQPEKHGPERRVQHTKKISLDFNLTVMQNRKAF